MIGKGIEAKNAPNFPGQGHQQPKLEVIIIKPKP